MGAPKKAFSVPPPPAPAATTTAPKARRFELSRGGEEPKKLVGFKLSADIPEQVEMKAIAMRRVLGRKVWPAHVVESAIRGFFDLSESEQRGLIERYS